MRIAKSGFLVISLHIMLTFALIFLIKNVKPFVIYVQFLTYGFIAFWFLSINFVTYTHNAQACSGIIENYDHPSEGILSTEGQIFNLFILSGWFAVASGVFVICIKKGCE